jgi:hypothetical protein
MEPSLRQGVYALLIVTATAGMLSRVMALRTPDPRSPTPFFSANDRSRWATIRALVEEGTYAVDRVVFDAQKRPVRGWHTIDLVRHVGADGKLHYYSSKPTLLPTLLAGEYWLIRMATGATLAEQPGYVVRLMLVWTNVLPLACALVLLARRVEALAASDAARLFTMTAACFGTFLTTFAVTLNNHLVAAISLVVGLELVWPLLADFPARHGRRAVAAGVAMGFVAANELPALVLVVLVAASLLWRGSWSHLLGYLLGASLVAAAAVGTNWLAHGDWRPPYAHRQDGPLVTHTEAAGAHHLDAGALPPDMIIKIHAAGLDIASQVEVEVRIRRPASSLPWCVASRRGRRCSRSAAGTTGTTIPIPTGSPIGCGGWTVARRPRGAMPSTAWSGITACFRSRRCGCGAPMAAGCGWCRPTSGSGIWPCGRPSRV